MDLSKEQKKKRDSVEAALFPLEKILEDLAECQVRVDATMKVWPETVRTLKPAQMKQAALLKELHELQAKLEQLWQRGFEKKWKEL